MTAFPKRILFGLTLVALPVCASAQPASSKKYADVNGWAVLSYSHAGSHMRCGAVAPGDSGSLTSFEKSREGWTVLVRTTVTGDSVQGTIEIDGRTFGGPFYRMEDDRVGLFLKDAQLKKTRSGKFMTVTIGVEKTQVSLSGVNGVFRKVAECDKKSGA